MTNHLKIQWGLAFSEEAMVLVQEDHFMVNLVGPNSGTISFWPNKLSLWCAPARPIHKMGSTLYDKRMSLSNEVATVFTIQK